MYQFATVARSRARPQEHGDNDRNIEKTLQRAMVSQSSRYNGTACVANLCAASRCLARAISTRITSFASALRLTCAGPFFTHAHGQGSRRAAQANCRNLSRHRHKLREATVNASLLVRACAGHGSQTRPRKSCANTWHITVDTHSGASLLHCARGRLF